jgi:hypothetical protein
MATQRQLEANRANARHSTGPRTSRGKANARTNAVKHGLTAKYIVIGDEDPGEFEALRADLELEFECSTRLQYELVDHLTGLLWRRRRVPRLEAALVKMRQAEARAEAEDNNESEYLNAVQEEARRRFEASYENDQGAISRAIMNGTYGERIGGLREEVEAEWNEEGNTPQGEDLVEPDGETALLMLLSASENVDPLAKLARYDTTLMNAITRTLQHLHLLKAERQATKLIST